MQQLDGDITFQPRVPRLEDFSHSAGADTRDDAIRSDGRSVEGTGGDCSLIGATESGVW